MNALLLNISTTKQSNGIGISKYDIYAMESHVSEEPP